MLDQRIKNLFYILAKGIENTVELARLKSRKKHYPIITEKE